MDKDEIIAGLKSTIAELEGKIKTTTSKSSNYKALEDKLAAIEKEREEAEAARLAEQQKFQELYTKEKEKVEKAQSQLNALQVERVTESKKSALRQQLGGTVRDDFLRLANLDNISVSEDGTIDMESVKTTAVQFKTEYPEIFGKPGSVRTPYGEPPVDGGDKMIDIDKLAREDPEGFRDLLKKTLSKSDK